MGIKKMILTSAVIVASTSTFAAKPISIKYIKDIIVQNDLIYSHYKVSCSDGRSADISAWDNRRKWCTGKGGQSNCSKKQITAAKTVCQ